MRGLAAGLAAGLVAVPLFAQARQPDPTRVLFVEGAPRWSYRYAKNALLDARPDLRTQVWLCDAGADFVQERSAGLPALKSLPRTPAELGRYDVILIGDVPLARIGATDRERQAWIDAIVGFVAGGGGVGFLAGKQMPGVYRGTTLIDLLPVELEPKTDADDWSVNASMFRPVVDKQPPGMHPLLKLGADQAASAKLWGSFLRFAGYYRVVRETDGSETLLSHETDQNRHGRRPILVLGTHGTGRTCFVGTDELWRMRKPSGEAFYDAFWCNVVRHLAGRDPQPIRSKPRPVRGRARDK